MRGAGGVLLFSLSFKINHTLHVSPLQEPVAVYKALPKTMEIWKNKLLKKQIFETWKFLL